MSTRNPKLMPGNRFGHWTVIDFADRKFAGGTFTRPTYKYFMLCKCDCGNIREVASQSLASGKSKSCGCKRRMTYAERYEKMFAHLKERDEQFNATKKHNLEK